MRPTVAAAICTHGRPEQLRRALASLAAQTVPPAEVLVVDNAPPDDRARRVVAGFPGVRYLVEPAAGLDFARNRAVDAAGAEVVALLDDDAVADPDWIEATAAAFAARPGLAACLGRIEPLALETDGQILFERSGGFSKGAQRIALPPPAGARLHGWPAPLIAWSISVGSGCSMAVRRAVVQGLGGFDEALDLGAALPGGGDLDMIWRMLAAGHPVVYEPAVRVRHEHRREVEDVLRQIVGHNRGLIAMLTRNLAAARGRHRLELLAFLGWRLLKPGVRLVRRALGREPLPARALLRLWAGSWTALLAYPAARRTARLRRGAAEPTAAAAPASAASMGGTP